MLKFSGSSNAGPCSVFSLLWRAQEQLEVGRFSRYAAAKRNTHLRPTRGAKHVAATLIRVTKWSEYGSTTPSDVAS